VKEIYNARFSKTIDSYMYCPIKDFSETQEETYPSSIAMKIMQRV